MNKMWVIIGIVVALLVIGTAAYITLNPPSICCRARTAECAAMCDGITIAEYCAQNPGEMDCWRYNTS